MTDYRNITKFTRHGGAYDRGSADGWYERRRDPHYYVGASYSSDRVSIVDMSAEEIAAYNDGYSQQTDHKDWGRDDEL